LILVPRMGPLPPCSDWGLSAQSVARRGPADEDLLLRGGSRDRAAEGVGELRGARLVDGCAGAAALAERAAHDGAMGFSLVHTGGHEAADGGGGAAAGDVERAGDGGEHGADVVELGGLAGAGARDEDRIGER